MSTQFVELRASLTHSLHGVLDKIFEGRLPQVLETFNAAIWQQPAA